MSDLGIFLCRRFLNKTRQRRPFAFTDNGRISPVRISQARTLRFHLLRKRSFSLYDVGIAYWFVPCERTSDITRWIFRPKVCIGRAMPNNAQYPLYVGSQAGRSIEPRVTTAVRKMLCLTLLRVPRRFREERHPHNVCAVCNLELIVIINGKCTTLLLFWPLTWVQHRLVERWRAAAMPPQTYHNLSFVRSDTATSTQNDNQQAPRPPSLPA